MGWGEGKFQNNAVITRGEDAMDKYQLLTLALFSAAAIAAAPKPQPVRWGKRRAHKPVRPADHRAEAAARDTEWWREQP